MLLYKTITTDEINLLLNGSLKDSKDLSGLITVRDAIESYKKNNSNYWTVLNKNLFDIIDPIHRSNIVALSMPEKSSIMYKDTFRTYDMLDNTCTTTKLYLNGMLNKELEFIDEIYFDESDSNLKLIDKLYPILDKRRKSKKCSYFGNIDYNTKARFIITPLMQDIMYAVCSTNNLNNNETIYVLKKIQDNINIDNLDKVELLLFKDLYVNGKSINEVLEYVLKQNNMFEGIISKDEYNYYDPYDYDADFTIRNYKYVIDPLDVLNTLLNIKRSIIRKLIESNLKEGNFSLPVINLVEDDIKYLRVGVDINKDEPKMYYRDEELDIDKQNLYKVRTIDIDDAGRGVYFSTMNYRKR